MSESDGLKKLTEYLNQTRRQAETAIDVLNKKIDEMEQENNTCLGMNIFCIYSSVDNNAYLWDFTLRSHNRKIRKGTRPFQRKL